MVRVFVCAALLTLPTMVFGESRVATPAFSMGGGDYSTVVMVRITVSTPGATIRFTQNGLDPTESDPVIVSGSRIAVNTSLTLKARAWKAGLQPSEVRAETYRIASVPAGPRVGPGDAAAGGGQSVLAMPDGRVFAWSEDAPPLPVDGLSRVTNVAAGTAHALAVAQDGQVYGWGANGSGQLGDGTHTRRWQPVRIAGLTNVVQVVAGRGHSMALTSDGRVFAFGANSRGQLGIDSPIFALLPTPVASLSNVVAIDAGDTHSVAVTRTGELFAWGANEHGQLGDGSREDRRTPVRIGLIDVIGVAAGGDHTLALGRDGAVYSWGLGTRGQLGTGSTAPALAPAAINGLLAFAVAAGRNFSAAVRHDGALVTWGANEAGQLGDGTQIDRTTPVVGPALTGISTIALGHQHAIAVTSAGEVWTWGREASLSATFTGVENWGPPIAVEELQPPTLQPPAGAYPAPQTVTLVSANIDDTLRYTLDGSEPTAASTIYTEPIVVSTTTTVTARAFSSIDGVEPSAIVSQSYTIDLSPPSILVEVAPPLTAAWMTTPVTVSFRCDDDSGSVSCPAPVTVTTEGRAQLITGTAVDPAGNQATASVEVSVDLTPPSVLLDGLPDDGITDQAQITLRGRVSDAASGLADVVRCNGSIVMLIHESFECLVDLRPGVNSVTLQARDVAGHVMAAGIEITRVGTASRLVIAPQFRALVTNEVAALSLRDNFGATVMHAVWTSSDTGVVALSSDDPPLITALAPGTVTVTAARDGLVAEATIAVHAGLELAPGTTRWTIGQTPGYALRPPIYTSRVNADVPDLFIVESLGSGEALLRAATSDGEVLWQQHSPGVPLMGDTFGGVIAGVPYETGWFTEFRAYVRVGSAGGVQPWRYESAGRLLHPAQAPDGTLHAIENVIGRDYNGQPIWDKHIISLDGKTGRLLHRFPIPRETRTFTAAADGTVIRITPRLVCTSTRAEEAPRTAGPVIGSDGRAYFLVRRRTYQAWAWCLEHGGPAPIRDIEQGIDLVITSADAAPALRPLYAQRCQTEADIPQLTVCDGPFSPEGLMPDGIGGLLATWRRTAEVVSFNVRVEPVLTRWDADNIRTDRADLAAFLPDFVGQRGIAYRGAHTAYDVASGAQTWVRAYNHLIPMAATPDGGVAMLDSGARQLHQTDATGAIVSSQPFSLDSSAIHEFGQWIGLKQGAITSITGKLSDATRWRSGGNRQGQLRLRTPGVGIFAKSHPVLAPLNFQHVSIRITPTFQAFWRDLKPNEFVHLDEYDNYFMTIGAGTAEGDTSLTCSGTLTKGLNREKDVEAESTNLERLPLHALDEVRLINDLYVHFDAYKDDLPYACLPEMNPGKYNSNSFASGILRRVGAPLPVFPTRGTTAPGWPTPVPPNKFDPQ